MSPPTRVVWIEMFYFDLCEDCTKSPPTRVVWIEIWYCKSYGLWTTGHHPHGWCGLKSTKTTEYWLVYWSPPTRVVWIEIALLMVSTNYKESPPTRVVWIEITWKKRGRRTWKSHHPHGWCGLKWVWQISSFARHWVTTHTGGVDWNWFRQIANQKEWWSPPTRVVWIEIMIIIVEAIKIRVTTHTGGVDWNSLNI